MHRIKLLKPLKIFWYESSNKDFLMYSVVANWILGTITIVYWLRNPFVFLLGTSFAIILFLAFAIDGISLYTIGVSFTGLMMGFVLGLFLLDHTEAFQVLGFSGFIGLIIGAILLFLRSIHRRVRRENFRGH